MEAGSGQHVLQHLDLWQLPLASHFFASLLIALLASLFRTLLVLMMRRVMTDPVLTNPFTDQPRDRGGSSGGGGRA